MNEGFENRGDVGVREWAAVIAMVPLKRGGEVAFEDGEINPIEGDQDFLVEPAASEAVPGVCGSEIRNVPADERLAVGDGLEEGKAEAFLDGSGYEMSGTGDPRLEIRGGARPGGEVIDDIKLDGQALFSNELSPCLVDGKGGRIRRRPTDGEMAACRGKGGEEDELSEVLASDAADGGEEDGGMTG